MSAAAGQPLIGVRVTARLLSAPCITQPVMLDSLTLYGIGAWAALKQPERFARPVCPELYDWPQPFAVLGLDDEAVWWHACSQITPMGAMVVAHQHRRPPMAQYEQAGIKSVNVASGPDKLRRSAVPQRIDMMRPQWTAVLDPERCEDLRRRIGLPEMSPQALLGHLLLRCAGVGSRVGSGRGAIEGWEIVTDATVTVERFMSDLTVRHLPAALMTQGAVAPPFVPGMRASQAQRDMPLRAPYHHGVTTTCIQLTELRERGGAW